MGYIEYAEEMNKMMLYSGTEDVNNRYEEIENDDTVELNYFRQDPKTVLKFLKNKKRVVGNASKKGRTLRGLGFIAETNEDLDPDSNNKITFYRIEEYVFYEEKDGNCAFKKIVSINFGAAKLAQRYFEKYKEYLISQGHYVELPLDFREQLKKPDDIPTLH